MSGFARLPQYRFHPQLCQTFHVPEHGSRRSSALSGIVSYFASSKAALLAAEPAPCCDRGMRALGSIGILMIVALIGMFVYRSYLTGSASGGAVANPTQTIDAAGL